MSESVTVRVEGLQELAEALTQIIPRNMQGNALQAALAAGARPIVAEAKALAPVDTGTLRRAIYSFRNSDSTPENQIRSIGVRSGRRYQAKGKRKNQDAYYWKWVEFGHRIGTRKTGYLKKTNRPQGKGGTSSGMVPARPFLRPAFESEKNQALDSIVDGLRDALAKGIKEARW